MASNFTPTNERLAMALKEARAPEWMVTAAREGRYDDYKSPLAFPIMQLVADCRQYGLTRIIKRAQEGEFDSVKQEADEWALTEEGRQILSEFGLEKESTEQQVRTEEGRRTFVQFHQQRYTDEDRGTDERE